MYRLRQDSLLPMNVMLQIHLKQAVVNAKREDIRIIKSPVGMPARAINSPLLERLDAGETFTARKCNGCLTACKKDDSIPYCISRALIAAVKGDWDNGLFLQEVMQTELTG